MSISIVTFADLGKFHNLKTPDIVPIIDKFSKENLLEQVICRRAKGFSFSETQSAISEPIFFASKAVGRLVGQLISSRELEWFLIDKYAQHNLKKAM